MGWFSFDRQHEVQPEVEQVLRGTALGVQRVGEDTGAGTRQIQGQLAQRRPFGRVLLPAEAELADHRAGVEIQRRQLLLGGLVEWLAVLAQVPVIGSKQHLPFHRDSSLGVLVLVAICWFLQDLLGRPGGQQALHLGRVDALENVVPAADPGSLVAPGRRALGWQGVTRRKRRCTTRRDPEAAVAPDRVQRRFEAAEPNRLWVRKSVFGSAVRQTTFRSGRWGLIAAPVTKKSHGVSRWQAMGIT